jgi:hypothetical protein|tara:strand:- start:64 stop:312 length:249 start_codon:yes stop_codon:yes gene_type:complete
MNNNTNGVGRPIEYGPVAFAENARPKSVTVTFTRDTNGSYHVDEASFENVVNQHQAYDVRLNARAVMREIRNAALKRKLTVN